MRDLMNKISWFDISVRLGVLVLGALASWYLYNYQITTPEPAIVLGETYKEALADPVSFGVWYLPVVASALFCLLPGGAFRFFSVAVALVVISLATAEKPKPMPDIPLAQQVGKPLADRIYLNDSHWHAALAEINYRGASDLDYTFAETFDELSYWAAQAFKKREEIMQKLGAEIKSNLEEARSESQ